MEYADSGDLLDFIDTFAAQVLTPPLPVLQVHDANAHATWLGHDRHAGTIDLGLDARESLASRKSCFLKALSRDDTEARSC